MHLDQVFSKDNFLEHIDQYRLITSEQIDEERKSAFSQYFTPSEIARFMASLFENFDKDISLLDPGAGVGSLSAAFVEKVINDEVEIETLQITCYEKDEELIEVLNNSLSACRNHLKLNNAELKTEVKNQDFIHEVAQILSKENGLFSSETQKYSHCIMNPPYQKINSKSEYRKELRSVGIETSNLYAGFMALAIKLLKDRGEIVAIIPRSFCNGVYFRPFRKFLLDELNIKQVHVFNARNKAFKDDEVLQENIIIHGIKDKEQGNIKITTSQDSSFDSVTERVVTPDKVIKPEDKDQMIHITTNNFDQMVVDHINVFTNSLADLGLKVSTGPVVDFRLKDAIQNEPDSETYPLIYPSHLNNGRVKWPKPNGRKANAIKMTHESRKYLMISGWYVLTRRFSSKEERRRIYASEYNPTNIDSEFVGFENHLNVIHQNKKGLDKDLARGIKIYLNSTLVDQYFRQFSGHTQVNATDLKRIKYPDLETLKELGKKAGQEHQSQKEIDQLIETIIDRMAPKNQESATNFKQKIDEALEIIKTLDLPNKQRNDRSALTLLALLDVKPNDDWKDASEPLMGITPIMDFIAEHYGVKYAPNTRETIRRQTMHQFVDAGIAIQNPDEPLRPINSPNWCYQIEEDTLKLIKSYGSDDWESNVNEFMENYTSLAERYAKKRNMQKIPLKIDGEELQLSPGKHSQLIKDIVEKFGPRYAPGGTVLYVGDTGSKLGYYDEKAFKEIGLEFDNHGKFPDVVLHFKKKNWLLLCEAVTSHGPVNPKRLSELKKLFADSKAGIVYVTAFPDKKTMAKYVSDISWETEVWVAEAPSHLIHFDGKRFLGPY
ncbi:BsuBI/PstI family type II restriction endonuclease [Gracilimonas tropica]|uniref:BsuBI/PstI family type II restriction endonuclease n=1 Tax=Gracilimonas tropica TaxID=454600 RepID=UPI00035D96DB|nr:BsuBI/PstI family type II restriction endonuclease [Gracilimonas tropica]